jgi:pimeloyl-ACP methyl ester carboxylesterase
VLVRFLSAFAACLAVATAARGEPLPAPTLISIDHRQLEVLALKRSAQPGAVVFENGSRETLDTWERVLPDLPRDLTIFAYNRPGYGRSDATSTPRDGRTIVEELRRLLQRSDVRPPYVLVGHSLGGLYMQLFARAHPDEVAGVVLVDAVYPGIIKRPEDFPLYTRIAKHLLLSAMVEREIDQIHATGDAVLALPAADQLPMVRLFNVPQSSGAIALDFGTVDDDPQLRARVMALYPRARQVILDSDHRIQTANPEAVAQAIRDVLAASRGERSLETATTR